MHAICDFIFVLLIIHFSNYHYNENSICISNSRACIFLPEHFMMIISLGSEEARI